MKRYKTYVFRDQDPAVGNVLEELNGYKPREINQISGLSASTIRNWRSKKTKRPQHTTLAAALGAVGKEFRIVDKK